MKKTINQLAKLINSPLSWRGAGGEAFFLVLLSVLTLTSCFSDDTTLGDRPLTEIIIDEVMDHFYNDPADRDMIHEAYPDSPFDSPSPY